MRRAAVIATLLASTRLAAAEPPGLTPPMTPTPDLAPAAQEAQQGTPSYRAWTLGADLTAVGLLYLAVDRDDPGLAQLSIGTYFLGAPFVHLMKKRPQRALGSLGLRVGLPLLGAMIGAGMHEPSSCDDYYDICEDNGFNDEMAMGVVVGVIAASALDTIYLAKGDPPKAAQQPMWQPTLRTTNGGFALGLKGKF